MELTKKRSEMQKNTVQCRLDGVHNWRSERDLNPRVAFDHLLP